jgi:hypothetical protein
MADKYLTNHFIQRILSTLPDKFRKSASLIDRFDAARGNVILRGIEAGEGVRVEVVDADGHTGTAQSKIVISATGGGGGGLPLRTALFVAISNQTVFHLPLATVVVSVAVNGLGATHWTHADPDVVFDPAAEGYALEAGDQVVIQYYE